MKKFRVSIIGAGVIFVAVLALVLHSRYQLRKIDENNLPKIIQADWIDLDRIGQISKFRSGSGHDFSGNGETCRSMKHYFNAVRSQEEQRLVSRNNGTSPSFSPEGAIAIYSPVDGEIVAVREEGLGAQVHIRPEKYPDFTIRLFHVFPLEGFGEGRKVAAGEQIGQIGRIQNTDIAVSVGGLGGQRLVSYFQVLPDELFAKYRSAGVAKQDDLIITREYRDAHPLECESERFSQNHDGSVDEFVFINGYSW